MKKLRLNLQQLEGTEVLTRSQLKKVLGGDGGSDILFCKTKCTGDTWNPVTARYDHGTTDCLYTPPIGELPGSCDSPYSVNASSCS